MPQPLHVRALATTCDLGYAPMAYLLFEKGGGGGDGGGGDRNEVKTADERESVQRWVTTRREEERNAGLEYTRWGRRRT